MKALANEIPAESIDDDRAHGSRTLANGDKMRACGRRWTLGSFPVTPRLPNASPCTYCCLANTWLVQGSSLREQRQPAAYKKTIVAIVVPSEVLAD